MEKNHKKFTAPEMEIVIFEADDIIASSGGVIIEPSDDDVDD